MKSKHSEAIRSSRAKAGVTTTCILWMMLGVLAGDAAAATGDQIFQQAACALLNDVITKDFGAMISVIAGSLAILSSVMGSFKGAWALLFVSIGCYVLPTTVDVIFPGLCNG